MAARLTIASSEFIRNVGYWQNEALRRPVGITHHGRERLVLTNPEDYDAPRAGGGVDHAAAALALADAEAVFANLEEAFVAFDARLCVTRSNAAADEMLGLSPDWLRGARLAEVFAQPFALVLEERLQRAMRARKAEAFEAPMNALHLSVRVFPLSDGAGVLLGNRTELRDERVRLGVADALCAATNRHPHAAGIKLDASGRIIGLHDSLCALTGWAREEIVGQRLVDLLRPDQRDAVTAALERVMDVGAPEEMQVVLPRSDGRETGGVVTMAPILADFATHGAMVLWVRESLIAHAEPREAIALA